MVNTLLLYYSELAVWDDITAVRVRAFHHMHVILLLHQYIGVMQCMCYRYGTVVQTVQCLLIQHIPPALVTLLRMI